MAVIISFLMIFPFAAALLMYVTRVNRIRNVISYISAGILIAATGLLCALWAADGLNVTGLYETAFIPDRLILISELILMVYVTALCIKYKRYWVCLLSIVPTLLIAWFELETPEKSEAPRIVVDHLSILMCVIIGIIGSFIIIYAVGYMHGYHHHHTEFRDRRYYFFTLLFVFLGAMYGFVLSDNLLWIDFFWELTSVCSFLLIGYTHEPVAVKNSFRALWMNLLGGTALAVGIVYFGMSTGSVSLADLVELGQSGDPSAEVAVALIAFAALTKAAQMPFSTWLIGAMVAPTPSSALLHSATMVKAGIYVLFRLSPAMASTTTGSMISFIGGFTFLITSFMAIAQSDGKKVLAFSTISNLGLMVACAGVGTAETIWAGIFLMLFHAISKSLLFQDVGATENSLHSRDIEDMHGLLYILPRLAFFMFIGIAGMFLAPFGMLISKWSALKASVNEGNILLVFFICFGSATTSFYWTKWMGKIISVSHMRELTFKDITKKNELISLSVHAVLMIALCMLFPLLSRIYVNPLVEEMFGVYEDVLSTQILLTLVVIICIIFAIPLLAFVYSKRMRKTYVLSYMNGVNEGDNRKFTDSMGEPRTLWMSNFYFHKLIGQRKLMAPSQFFAAAVLVVMMSMILGGVSL